MRCNRQNGIFVSICLLLSQPFLTPPVYGQDSLQTDYADQLQRIQPLEPDAAIQAFEIKPGFRIELISAEPMVMDPVAITFDEWGGAYVAEMRGYSELADQLLGRIKRLEDTDGDGRFDKSVLFADSFRWPTSVVCAFGGVLVADAPDIVFLKDADGDGQADIRQVLFTGFGTSNVQQLPNSLQWGLDNRIYGASGGNGGQLKRVEFDPETLGGQVVAGPIGQIDINGRDFRIDPRTLGLESIAGGTQFGMTFDRWGVRYVCSNSDHCQQVIFEDKYAARNAEQRISGSRVNIAADGPAAEVFRTSPVEPWRKVRTRLRVQGLVEGPIEGGGRAAGYFTSAAGIVCYDGDLFPSEYRGNLFVGDVGSNLVHRKSLTGAGIQLLAVRTEPQSEFLRSTDNWFRPVQMANAPDGSLILLDMYRETIEHPASLPPIIKKHLDLNSGNQRGRLYRIVPENSAGQERLMPGNADLKQLVQMLGHPNGWHRSTAARLLFERSRTGGKAPAITQMLQVNGIASRQPDARIRSMYLLADLDHIHQEQLVSLLQDEHPQVRIHAVRLAETRLDRDMEDRISGMTQDPDVRVRYQVALALGEFGISTSGAIADLAATDGNDPWMQTALASSAYRNRAETIQRLVQRIREDADSLENCRPLLLELTGQLARSATDHDLQVVCNVLRAWPDQNGILPGEFIAGLMQMSRSRQETLRRFLEQAGLSLDEFVARATDNAKVDAIHPLLDEHQRVVAIGLLKMERPETVVTVVDQLLELNQPPLVRRAAIELASRFDNGEMGDSLLVALQSLSPDLRAATLQVLLSREAWTAKLLNQIEQGKLSPVLVDAVSRQRLVRHQNPTIGARARDLLSEGLNPDRAKLTDRYIEETGHFAGSVDKGREVFRKSCMACHRLEDHGNEIGPNLAAFANRGTLAMITNIIDPNREVDPRFLSYQVLLQDGRTLVGVIGNETATTIGLQNFEGKTETLLRNEIEMIQSTTMSLMPENFENDISPESLADLIAYLVSQGS